MTAAFAKQNSGIVCQTLNTMATWKIWTIQSSGIWRRVP
jgi:hypothetical protein